MLDREIDEAFEAAPPEVKDSVTSVIRRVTSGGIAFGGDIQHPIIDKFTENHVDKFLDISSESENRVLDYEKGSRWFNLGYVGIVTALFVFLLVYLGKTDKDLLIKTLELVFVFAGGFGGGYGFKAFREKRES